MYATSTSGLQMIPASPVSKFWLTWAGVQVTTGDGQLLQFFTP